VSYFLARSAFVKQLYDISSAVYDYENLLLINVGGWVAVFAAQSEFEFRHPSKIINGRHKQRSGQHTLAREKIYKKRNYPSYVFQIIIIKALFLLVNTYVFVLICLWPVSVFDTLQVNTLKIVIKKCFLRLKF
jgi:hypothetical protein